jgi:hypothetical protein
MLKHPDPEVQFLVEMLESQRDQAVAQAAAYFRMVQELQQELGKLSETDNSTNSDMKAGGTD